MRRVTAGTFQMAALPWTGKKEFLDRELGINLTEFRADMLDWRNNKWKDSPPRPASNWRQYLLYYQYSATADSAQGTEWQLNRIIPTLEFLRYDGGIYTLDSEGRMHLTDGTGSSGAKTIGYNPYFLIQCSVVPTKEGSLIDNVQDAIDAIARRLMMMGGGLRNIMDVDKDELNNMTLCGTVSTAIWRSPGKQEWTSTFYKPWYPRNSAIFGSGHDIFRGDSLLVSGKGNLIDNNAFTETAHSIIAGLENKVLCDKESATKGLTYNLVSSVLAGQCNKTMNAVSASIIGGYENIVGDWVLEEEEEEEEDGEKGESLGVSGLLVAGGKHRVYNAGHSIVTGYRNLLAAGSDCSAIFGQGNKASGGSVGSLVAGEGNLVVNTGLSVIGGTGNKLTDESWHSAIFGAGNGIHNGSVQSFIAGSGNRITGTYGNTHEGSVNSAIFGAGNEIANRSVQSFIAGAGNRITGGSVNSAIFGAGNVIANASAMSFIGGAGNTITESAHSAVFGAGNSISGYSVMSFLAGAENSISTSTHSAVFGTGNHISGYSVQSFIAGNANAIANGSDNSATFGRDCIISDSKQSFIAGLGNRISGSHSSFAGGLKNRISDGSHQSTAFGAENIIAD